VLNAGDRCCKLLEGFGRFVIGSEFNLQSGRDDIGAGLLNAAFDVINSAAEVIVTGIAGTDN
jgi:hypothetical protein